MTGGVVFAPALASLSGFAPPLRGAGLTDHLVFDDAALAWEDGFITFAGRRADLPPSHDPLETFHVDGAVIPGLVDCHTHVPFVGWRADEFEARLAGRTYRDLHTGGGGGIYRSARMLAEASEEEVLDFCRPFLVEMLEHGTTTLEFKTGYGLSVEGELRQARLARRLADGAPQTVTVTLLACHAIPEQSKMSRVLEALRDLELEYEPHPLLGESHIMNVGTIRGGTRYSQVPDRCTVSVDFRFLPSQSALGVKGKVEEMIAELAAEDPEFDAEVGFNEHWLWGPRIPYEVNDSWEILRTVERATEVATGAPAEHVGMMAWTDMAVLGQAGTEAVNIGPGGSPLNFPDEYVLESEFEGAVRTYVGAAIDYCNQPAFVVPITARHADRPTRSAGS